MLFQTARFKIKKGQIHQTTLRIIVVFVAFHLTSSSNIAFVFTSHDLFLATNGTIVHVTLVRRSRHQFLVYQQIHRAQANGTLKSSLALLECELLMGSDLQMIVKTSARLKQNATCSAFPLVARRIRMKFCTMTTLCTTAYAPMVLFSVVSFHATSAEITRSYPTRHRSYPHVVMIPHIQKYMSLTSTISCNDVTERLVVDHQLKTRCSVWMAIRLIHLVSPPFDRFQSGCFIPPFFHLHLGIPIFQGFGTVFYTPFL